MKLYDDEQERARLLGRMRGYLARRRSPRAILSGIMLATAMGGFLASAGMLKLGLTQMWLRYPLAVLAAWGVFLLLLDFPDVGDAEGCLVFLGAIIIIALAVGAVMAIGGLIMEAETLLAEVLLDTLLVSAFYRRLRRKEPDWWLHGMLRQTVKPVLLTMGLLTVIGLLLHFYAPEAHSIGVVWRHWWLAGGR